jgi:hypothetical protein
MGNSMIKAIKKLLAPKWEVRRTIWPYPEGYGVYCPATSTILDTGLSKEQAQKIVDELNARRGE